MAITKFQPFQVQSEGAAGESSEAVRVMKPMAQATEPQPYRMEKLDKRSGQTYSQIKAKYGPLAATDVERKAKTQKDSRFTLNPLLRGPLSVEEEEKRVIEERVTNRVKQVEDDVRKQADARGYEEGLKKGYEEAFMKFRAEGTDRVKKFDELLRSLEGAKAKIFEENEKVLVEIVFQVAKTLLLKELQADPTVVSKLAAQLIERIGTRENVTILINPSDMKSLEILKEDLQKNLGETKNLRIEASADVRGGGCIVETEWNAIDASIETQLKSIHEALQSASGG
ncbi:MAG: FliH/SctL family protein [Bacteriovoracia bacterium]